MEITESKDMVHIIFESTEEIARYIREQAPKASYSQTYVKPRFCKDSFKEAEQKLLYGDSKSSEQLIRLSEELTKGVELVQGQYQWDVTGDYFDIGEVVTGNPEHWLYPELEEKPVKHFHLILNTAASCGIDQDIIERRGAVVLSLIESLLNDRYDITLDVGCYSTNVWKSKGLSFFIRIDTKNGYSRDSIAFMVSNVSFLRRIYFGVCEAYFKQHDLFGYGMPASVANVPEDAKDALVFDKLHIGGNEYEHYTTDEAARKRLQELISKYQVVI